MAQRVELESVPKAQRRVGELKKDISALGNITWTPSRSSSASTSAISTSPTSGDDVQKSKKELEGIIADITEEMRSIFGKQFAILNESFQQTFSELFGEARPPWSWRTRRIS